MPRPTARPVARPGARPPGETLPPMLARELKRAARPTAVNDALKAMEKFLRARAKGNTAEAHRAAISAKQAAPRSVSVREALGLIAYERKEWHEAAQELLAFRRLTGEHRHDPLIADCYIHLGRATRALEFLAGSDRARMGAKPWAQARIVRARALAETNRKSEAIDFLAYEIRHERNERARATLTEARTELHDA